MKCGHVSALHVHTSSVFCKPTAKFWQRRETFLKTGFAYVSFERTAANSVLIKQSLRNISITISIVNKNNVLNSLLQKEINYKQYTQECYLAKCPVVWVAQKHKYSTLIIKLTYYNLN